MPEMQTDIKTVKDEFLKELINQQRWQFAETYAKTAPHEYIVNKWNGILFKLLCEKIDKEGYEKKWWDGKKYKYLDFDGYKYWHYEIILNREAIKNQCTHKIIRENKCVYCGVHKQ